MPTIAEIVVIAGAVKVRSRPTRGKSGRLLSVYVDCRKVCGDERCFPAAAVAIAEYLSELDKYALAGVALGGVMFSPAVALLTKRAHFAVRGEAKSHGLRKLIEGGPVRGRRMVVIEDAVTTGGSLIGAIETLRRAGAVVTEALCLVAHRPAEAKKRFADVGVPLTVLATPAEIYQVMFDRHRSGHAILAPKKLAKLRAWVEDS